MNIDIVDVPYKTASVGYVPAFLNGDLQFVFATQNLYGTWSGNKQGKALAVTGDKRHPNFPTLPTFVELDLPDITSLSFLMFTAAGTPRPIVSRINAAVVGTLNEPELNARLSRSGMRIVASSPEALGKIFLSQLERNRQVAQQAGIKPE